MRVVSVLAAVPLLIALVATPCVADVPVSAEGRAAASPDVAVASDGTVYVLWVDRGAVAAPPANGGAPAGPAPTPGGAPAGGRSHASNVDLLLARSRDGGRTFDPPVRVNATPGQVWSFPTSRPELAIGARGTLHVLFTANDVNAAGKPVIVPMYARSTDGGRTFEPARKLASVPDSDLSHVIHGGYSQAETFGTIATDAKGGVHVYWIDTRFMQGANDTGALLAVHSRDDGRTFGAEQVLAKSGACPCCQVTSARGDGNATFIGMRVVDEGFRDSSVLRSDDGGVTFGAPARLGADRWKIDGCPLKPTSVAVRGSRVYAAAFNGATEPSGVRFAASSDGGRTFGAFAPVHPDAAVSDYPTVVALRGDRVRVFWHAKAKGDPARAIYGAVSTDGGRTFAPVETLATGANVGYPMATALPSGEAGLVYVGGDRIWFRAVK